MELLNRIKQYKIVPVIVLSELSQTRPVLNALYRGGLPIAEITFRTDHAADAIRLGCELFPDMLIGAGTVISAKQADQAIASGAKFIVGPGFSAEVAQVCQAHDIFYLPGCVTPTEIITALSYGIQTIKFFPCSNFGGLHTIRSLSAVFPSVQFIPTGGISETNLTEYLSFSSIPACGGSWMMKGSFEEIQEKTAHSVALVQSFISKNEIKMKIV